DADNGRHAGRPPAAEPGRDCNRDHVRVDHARRAPAARPLHPAVDPAHLLRPLLRPGRPALPAAEPRRGQLADRASDAPRDGPAVHDRLRHLLPGGEEVPADPGAVDGLRLPVRRQHEPRRHACACGRRYDVDADRTDRRDGRLGRSQRMSRDARRKAAQAKEAKQKKIVIGGLVVLLAVVGYQAPKLLHHKSGATGATGTTSSVAGPDASALPATPARLVDAGPPQASAGQLVSFQLFKAKDPFVQQVSDITGETSTTPAPVAAPPATTTPAPAPVPSVPEQTVPPATQTTPTETTPTTPPPTVPPATTPTAPTTTQAP